MKSAADSYLRWNEVEGKDGEASCGIPWGAVGDPLGFMEHNL